MAKFKRFHHTATFEEKFAKDSVSYSYNLVSNSKKHAEGIGLNGLSKFQPLR
jgi:hypothetical protein